MQFGQQPQSGGINRVDSTQIQGQALFRARDRKAAQGFSFYAQHDSTGA